MKEIAEKLIANNVENIELLNKMLDKLDMQSENDQEMIVPTVCAIIYCKDIIKYFSKFV